MPSAPHLASAALWLLSLALLPAGAAAQEELLRAPYLQRGAPTEMTVAWGTRAEEPSSVCLGEEPDRLEVRFDGAAGRQHEVRITGLLPGRRYYYQIARDERCPPTVGGDEERYLRTSPTPGSAAPFRLWVVGDSGTGGSEQAAVVGGMSRFAGAAHPDLFLHLGDMAYDDGSFVQLTARFYAPYAHVLRNTVCWPALGNHEVGWLGSDSATESGPYYEGFVLPRAGEAGGLPSGTEAYYSFDYANAHFVVLDSADSPIAPGSAMLAWLEADLAATDQPWLIAYWHHPPYSNGTHFDTEPRMRAMRAYALPILESHGVDLVLAGHSHIYERSYPLHGAYALEPDDYLGEAGSYIVSAGSGRLEEDGPYLADGSSAVYVVAGHGGASLRQQGAHPFMYFAEPEHGSCLVDVDGGVLTLRNVNRFGEPTDALTLVKEEGLYLIEPAGGESYLAGVEVEIRWATVGLEVAEVMLERSLDGGETWGEIVATTPNDGSYRWSSPRVPTDRARVRVTDAAGGAAAAESQRSFSLTRVHRGEAIAWGARWEYADADIDPGGAGWRTERGGWREGPAQLGFGDGDEHTGIRNLRSPTYYFRRTFAVEGRVTRAELSVLFDDGFAVWINGQLVLDRNVEEGLDHGLYASAQSDDNEIASAVLDLRAVSSFVEGENFIAVLVKQSSASSDDISFDLQLLLDTELPPPPGDLDAGGGDGGASTPTDGGEIDPGGVGGGGGCACRAGAGRGRAPLSLLLLVGLVLALLTRRRRDGDQLDAARRDVVPGAPALRDEGHARDHDRLIGGVAHDQPHAGDPVAVAPAEAHPLLHTVCRCPAHISEASALRLP